MDKVDTLEKALFRMVANPLLAGLRVERQAAESAVLYLPVISDMLGPGGRVSRGVIFLIADSAMEIVTNETRRTVAQNCDIAFFGEAKLGDVLVANAEQRHTVDRKGMCDVVVRLADGTLIAEFRGHTREV